ncbi:MAG: hypothetical protein M1608_12470 [Candidatus Omnitrophica bacterium]|nr:hypothetical protein [Candidatus Omnitrophota bacterium]
MSDNRLQNEVIPDDAWDASADAVLSNPIDIQRRKNQDFARFRAICRKYADHLMNVETGGSPSFYLPFVFRERETQEACQRWLNALGIETFPFDREPVLSRRVSCARFLSGGFCNAETIHAHSFYIDNTLFMSEERLGVLDRLLKRFFSSWSSRNRTAKTRRGKTTGRGHSLIIEN